MEIISKKYHKIVQGVRKYFKEYKFPRAVIGLSGGIDSTLCAKLVADAIGSDRVFGVIMPDKGVTRVTSFEHAKAAAKAAGIKYAIHPINKFLKPFKKLPWKESHIAVINTKSRIRANILFNYANTHNALVIGTSNRSELLLGYFTKYGDGAIDIEVIGSLWKTEVFEMSKFLGLPDDIINKEPTAELFHGHTDEKELGAKYDKIDEILKGLIRRKKPKTELEKKIANRMKANEHKTKAVPIIKA